jgi:Ni,Fe-hydrogenase III component G
MSNSDNQIINHLTFIEINALKPLTRKEFLEYVLIISEQTTDARQEADSYLFACGQYTGFTTVGEYTYFLTNQLLNPSKDSNAQLLTFIVEFTVYLRLIIYFEQVFGLFLQLHKKVKRKEKYPEVDRLDTGGPFEGRYPTFAESHMDNFFGSLVDMSYRGELGWDNSDIVHDEANRLEELEKEKEEEREQDKLERIERGEVINEEEEEEKENNEEEDIFIDVSDVTEEEEEEEDGEFVLHTKVQYLVIVLEILKKHSFFKGTVLIDIIIIDHPSRKNRFEVTYLLLSPTLNTRYNVKTQIPGLSPLASVHHLFISALWSEREMWYI